MVFPKVCDQILFNFLVETGLQKKIVFGERVGTPNYFEEIAKTVHRIIVKSTITTHQRDNRIIVNLKFMVSDTSSYELI